MLSPHRWRPGGDLHDVLRRAALIALWLAAPWVALNALAYYVGGGGVGMDGHAYWLAGRLDHPYGPAPRERDAFLYSPLFAQAMRPLAWLPWPAFCGLLMLACAAAYYWLCRPLPWRWRAPLLLLCVPELLIVNIYPLLAVSLVLALRYPESLAFPALTKITPGGVGLVWFAVRRQWTHLLRAAAAVVVLVGVSWLAEPGLWREWVLFLLHHDGDGGVDFAVRLVLAVGLTVVAARRDRRWLLAVAFYLAMPLAGLGLQSMVPLLAAVRLVRQPTGAGNEDAPAESTGALERMTGIEPA